MPATSLTLLYFPSAVLLGALHALEPGHAKALTAAYLIGIKGTKRDAALLGLSVAATHSIVVITIAGMGLWLGQETFAGQATHWLERGSGLIAIFVGCWMLWRRLRPDLQREGKSSHHHQAPSPVSIQAAGLHGVVEIIDTPLGERLRFESMAAIDNEEITVRIARLKGQIEILILSRSHENPNVFLSSTVPGEPHEFEAEMGLGRAARDWATFSVAEPDDHQHDHHHEVTGHAHLDDAAHAAAHAETLPAYVKSGERPSLRQILAFGAAGGMIPCPASITVMLLALASGKAALGVFTVLGFSLGLALALVGVGVAIVTGLSRLSETGKLTSISRRAPVVSAGLVIVSGIAALWLAK